MTRHVHRFFGSAVLACIVCAGTARGDQLILEEGLGGYKGAADNSIYEDAPGNTNGGGSGIYAGSTATSRRRALIKFDLNQAGFRLPEGAVVTAVELTLELTKSGSGATAGDPYRLHRLTAAWGEGSADAGNPGGSGTAAQTGDATWSSNFFNLSEWSTPGGDFVEAPSAEFPTFPLDGVFPANNIYTITTEGMLEDVRGWLADPAGNHGWIMTGHEASTQTARLFGSSEARFSRRPRLTLTYMTPTPTPDAAGVLAWLLGLGPAPGDVNEDGALDTADLLQALLAGG